MNGFMMCVLLAATGQVSDTSERDFGWQINPDDGKLEYIVQVSPEKAGYMASAAKEQASEVPSDVAARLSRVVVRIGTEPIVSTPLEEVRKLPVVTTAVLANIEATAGRGRFSSLEDAPAGNIQHVAGDNSPPSLSAAPNKLPSVPGKLLDQASQLGNELSDALKSDLSNAINTRSAEAIRSAENLLAQNVTPNLTPNSAASGFLNDSRGSSSNGNKYNHTATQPATPPAGSSSGGLTSAPPAIGPMPPASNYPTAPAHNHAPDDGYHNNGTAAAPTNSSTIAGGGYAYPNYPAGNSSMPGATTGTASPGTVPGQPYGMTPLNGSSPSGNMAGGKFGGLPRGATGSPQYNEYATPGPSSGLGTTYPYGTQPPYGQGSNLPPAGYGGQGYVPDPLSIPSGYYQPTRVADNRSPLSVPSTSSGGTATGNTSSTPSSGSNNSSKGRTSGGNQDTDVAGTYSNRSGMENILPVMFVLSLVVNFYLGMLIRKLLTRYRSLLSSVRSQAI